MKERAGTAGPPEDRQGPGEDRRYRRGVADGGRHRQDGAELEGAHPDRDRGSPRGDRRPGEPEAWDDAFRAAETGNQKLRILFKIADAQMKAGDREAALRTLDQALVAERSMNPDELAPGPGERRNFMEMQIAAARAEAGDIAGAIRLANTIKHIQVQGEPGRDRRGPGRLGRHQGRPQDDRDAPAARSEQGSSPIGGTNGRPCRRSSRHRPGQAMWPAPWPRPTGWVRHARRGVGGCSSLPRDSIIGTTPGRPAPRRALMGPLS